MSTEDLPKYTESNELGNKGRRIVESITHDELRCLFREISKDDLGIDGNIEIIEGKQRTSKGRLLGVQIKCGLSYFKETSDEGFVYRGSMKHLNYWLGHSLPIILVLCDPETSRAYWVEISPGRAKLHAKGFSLLVPKENTFDGGARHKLVSLVDRPLAQDIVELSLYRLLVEKYETIEIAPILETPRDFYYFDELARIDNRLHLVKGLYKPGQLFRESDIDSILEGEQICVRGCGWDTYPNEHAVLIVFIAHSAEQLVLPEEVKEKIAKHPNIKFIRTVCTIGFGAGLTEVDDNGELILTVFTDKVKT